MIASVEYNKIPEKTTHIGLAKEDTLRFARSGQRAGKVVLDDMNVYRADAYYRDAIKQLNMPFKQMIRNKELYIIRTD